jgi:hypothetical protein
MQPVKPKAELTLERDALLAHDSGTTWGDYWTAHADAIRATEPQDRSRYRRLVDRLLSLVVSGDTANMDPLDTPWECEGQVEQGKPGDTGTKARCLWPWPEGVGGGKSLQTSSAETGGSSLVACAGSI